MTTTAEPTTEQTLSELLDELSPELRAQVRDFAAFLAAKQRRAIAQQAKANGWPEGYFERTAGSIPDFPNLDSKGIDPTLDDTADALRLDEPAEVTP